MKVSGKNLRTEMSKGGFKSNLKTLPDRMCSPRGAARMTNSLVIAGRTEMRISYQTGMVSISGAGLL
jgi:hypothetical protein